MRKEVELLKDRQIMDNKGNTFKGNVIRQTEYEEVTTIGTVYVTLKSKRQRKTSYNVYSELIDINEISSRLENSDTYLQIFNDFYNKYEIVNIQTEDETVEITNDKYFLSEDGRELIYKGNVFVYATLGGLFNAIKGTN